MKPLLLLVLSCCGGRAVNKCYTIFSDRTIILPLNIFNCIQQLVSALFSSKHIANWINFRYFE